MKRILVTGGGGFIGRHVLPLLVGRGDEVHAISSRAGGASSGALAACTWHQADLLSGGAAAAVVESVRPTHLLHLAWYTEPGKFWSSRDNLQWVSASLDLLRAFVSAGGRRFVGAGTCAEYAWTTGVLSETTTPLAPATLYGACKQSLGQMAEVFCRQEEVAFAWGRVFFAYGPGEHPARLVPAVTNALSRGEVAACTPGEHKRDFLHVADLADAFVTLLDSAMVGPVNLGSGEAVAVRDVVHFIADQLGARDLVRLGALPRPAHEPDLLVADVRRIRDLGWRPRYDLKAGLAQTVDWWQGEPAPQTEDKA